MDDSLELATFRGNDDPALVEAALACRACLSSAGSGYVREVSLTSEQALRLSLTA